MFQSPGAKITFKDVKDGLTNTIFIGEMRPAETSLGRIWMYENAGYAMGATTVPINYRTDLDVQCWIGTTIDTNVEGQPVYQTTPAGHGVADQELTHHSSWNWALSHGFKSRHPGGANFLFGDGSVHFLSEDIDHNVYQYLGCRDDGRHVEDVP